MVVPRHERHSPVGWIRSEVGTGLPMSDPEHMEAASRQRGGQLAGATSGWLVFALEEAQSGSVWHMAVSDSGSWPVRLVTCLSLHPPNTVLLVTGLGSWVPHCSLACCLLLNTAVSYREHCSPGRQRASPTTSAPSPSCPTRLSLVSGDCSPAAPTSEPGCCMPTVALFGIP